MTKDRYEFDQGIHAINYDDDYVASITQSTGGVRKVQKRFGTTMQIINEALS